MTDTQPATTVPGPRFSGPRIHLHVNGLALAGVALLAFSLTGGRWWLFGALILVPDVSMAGYLVSRRVGAITYNAGHSLVIPAALVAINPVAGNPFVLELGLIWATHIGIDHVFGYGYKYPTAFRDTNLQRV